MHETLGTTITAYDFKTLFVITVWTVNYGVRITKSSKSVMS